MKNLMKKIPVDKKRMVLFLKCQNKDKQTICKGIELKCTAECFIINNLDFNKPESR